MQNLISKVGLRLHLGQAPGPTYHHPYQKRTTRNSPSRERRRARRLAERKEEETSEALDENFNEVDNEKEQEIPKNVLISLK